MKTQATPPITVAFVLVSFRPDAPAGMERAVAAMASGLRKLGHRAVIITAAPQQGSEPGVIALANLSVAFPCDDSTLRDAIVSAGPELAYELEAALCEHHADLVVYVDALWGLGMLAEDVCHPARRVLSVHVVGHDADLRTALAGAHRVIAPSASVLSEAHGRGYRADTWQVVPNPLLVDPDTTLPGRAQREQLRLNGPVRAVARLGAEKGITGLLATAPPMPGRQTEVVLSTAGFESAPGSQAILLTYCQELAAASGTILLPALPWLEVPEFLAGAALTIVPSARETFGNLALESMSVGTPVVAHATGNLPDLVGQEAGVLVPLAAGPGGLLKAARGLLADQVRYHQACGAAYCRSRNYRSAKVAEAFLKAVL